MVQQRRDGGCERHRTRNGPVCREHLQILHLIQAGGGAPRGQEREPDSASPPHAALGLPDNPARWKRTVLKIEAGTRRRPSKRKRAEFESLRDLPDLEALKDAGLMRGDALVAEPDAEPEEADAGTGRRWLRSGVASDRVA